MSMIHEHHVQPRVQEDATMTGLPEGTLALFARAAAEQHRAVLELQSLFARHGGTVSQHDLTQVRWEATVKELEECRSFLVINFSPITIQLGWGGRAAAASGATPVPAQSYLQLPTDCNNAELAAAMADLEALSQPATVLFVRFRHLVSFAAGPLSPMGREAVGAVTKASPRKVIVPALKAEVAVVAANAERKGLLITNTSANKVSLGLGAPAVEGDDIVLEPGGSWGGTISSVLWRGAVNAIAPAESTLAVVEV